MIMIAPHMKPISFGIVGGGWRTEFYIRIAKVLPKQFVIGGIVMRDETKGKLLEQEWGIPTFRDCKTMLARTTLSFVVTSVPSAANFSIMEELVSYGMPVLSETPPAPNLEGLIQLNKKLGHAKIQVAEQYWFQPLHAARLAVIQSGMLGVVSQAQVSAAHGYHGVSLIRKMLGIGFDNAAIQAFQFSSPIIKGPDRSGAPKEEKLAASSQVIADLHFDGKLGVYDFVGDQYFSWIRSPRVLVRGDKGEINNSQVRYLQDFRTPVSLDFNRLNAGEDGNLEGYYHKGILLGQEWVYENPFIPARLTDDELAIASCLVKMDDFVQGGPSFYSLAEASQDHYLGMMISEAVKTNQPVTTTTQPWAENK